MSISMSKKQELHMEAYKTLVNLLQNEDNMFWRRSEILIAINGGMLTVVGLMRSSQLVTATPSSKAISVAICVIGVAVCVFWFLIAKRTEAFYNHWYEQLKFLEKQYLAPIQIFSMAEEFFAKGRLRLGDADFKLGLSARVGMFTALQTLSLIFSIVWSCIGIYLLFFT